MRKQRLIFVIPIFLLATFLFAANYSDKINLSSSGDSINVWGKFADSNNQYNFDKMMDVLTHQRCINCHPSDHVPKQGEDQHPHYFGMARGENDMGFAATNCKTCHQSENNDFSGVPGAPHWGLAPASMNWEGKSRIEIAKSLLNKSANGGRSNSDLVKHLTEDALVLWAWEPGIDASGKPREVPPVPKEQFILAVKEWFAAGAIIPQQ